MRMQIKGRWRIVDMELWDLDAIDLLGPAFIELRDEDQGQFRSIAVEGWMTLTPDGSLEGRIFFHMGDDSHAERDRSQPGAHRGRGDPHRDQGEAHRCTGGWMTTTATARDRVADAALRELTGVRPSDDAIGAAVAAAALLAERAALEISDRDRVIRIAKREGATLRALAEATGLSRQTIANICAAGSRPATKRARAS